MQYTVFISETPTGQWQATVPVLPNCTAEAPTREALLERIKANLAATPIIEALQIEVPINSSTNGHHPPSIEQEWPGFGAFKNDPWLNQIFDDIERQRDATVKC
ncbi:MAG: type II toxin-antitoxin system HicB family antitoxin [Blastocatellia bacterium]